MNRSSLPFNGLSDRTGFGLFFIVAFSIGLAAVLIAMGLVAVYAAV
jgi:ABC-type nickel/cobalt efflux system permease component RcnA